MQLNTAIRTYLYETSTSESNQNYKVMLFAGTLEMPKQSKQKM